MTDTQQALATIQNFLEWVEYHWESQDKNHDDFRVEAFQMARRCTEAIAALEVIMLPEMPKELVIEYLLYERLTEGYACCIFKKVDKLPSFRGRGSTPREAVLSALEKIK